MNMYEREFLDEIRDKRKKGNGIFSRKATRKGAVGPLRTAYAFMTAKEKRLLNGKCEVFNMNEILTLEQLKTFDKEKQKEMVENWRANFKGEEIIKKMGFTNKMKYYDLLDELGVKKANVGNVTVNKKKFSQKEIEEFKENVVGYEFYKTLPMSLKAELFLVYSERYSDDELTEKWGTMKSTVYQARAAVKQHLNKQKGKKIAISQPIEKEKSVAISALRLKEPEQLVPLLGKSINQFVEEMSKEVPEQAELDLKEQEVSPESVEEPVEPEIELKVEPEHKGMKFNFVDEGNAQDLEHQLKTIAEIFRNKSKLYKFEINITEIGENLNDTHENLEVNEQKKEKEIEKQIDILNLLKTLGQAL